MTRANIRSRTQSIVWVGLSFAIFGLPAPVHAQATTPQPSITLEAALAIAQVGIQAGKEKKSDVAIVVVDRSGLPLVVLRMDDATEQFVTGATRKAWTSVNLRASTRDLFEAVKKGQEDDAQLPFIEKSLLLMGGVPLKVGDKVVGAIGAAGCVSGLDDDAVARKAAEAFAQLLKKQ